MTRHNTNYKLLRRGDNRGRRSRTKTKIVLICDSNDISLFSGSNDDSLNLPAKLPGRKGDAKVVLDWPGVYTLHEKWSFPLRISSVNVTKSADLVTCTYETLDGKLHVLCNHKN